MSLKADTVTKDYVNDTEIFADIFNYHIYDGRQIIRPAQLTVRDSAKIALPYGADDAVIPVQKYRDVQKLCTVMTDGIMEYVLYGVENQSDIHYAMPVRNNLYDALEYAGQVEEAAKSHRRKRKKGENLSSGEFLSGFWKKDKLIPSVTVTIFFGAENWDGPMSLSDMMNVTDPGIRSCINDYKIHLIAPAQMSDNDIMKFRSSLREVLLFIKYSDNIESLNRILAANKKRFQKLERRAADVIKIITSSNISYDENKEAVNMCKAIEDMRLESRLIGKREGKRKGKREGELLKAKKDAKNFYDLGVDIDTIAQGVEYPVKTVKKWLALE